MCSVLLSVFGASFIAPIFYTASLVEHKFLLKTHYCEVHWPQDYRYHYTVITTAAHYFLTLIIVLVLYYKIYLRLRLRYVVKVTLLQTYDTKCVSNLSQYICANVYSLFM